jgi:hypothetical protein
MYNSIILYDYSIPVVTTTRFAEDSGTARHLQKMLLQIDKKYYFSVICISDK